MLFILSFNLTKLNSQLNTITTNNIQSLTDSTCDSLPITFQKVLELTDDPLFTYDLLTYPNGDYLAIGNYGTHERVQQGFLIKFSSTGVIHWAKEIGAYYPPDPIVFDWYFYRNSIGERLESGIVLSDSSAIIIGERQGWDTNRIAAGLIFKIDFNGKMLWTKTIKDNNDLINRINLNNISKTVNNKIFTEGIYDSSDGFVLEIDSQGNIINTIILKSNSFSHFWPTSNVKKNNTYYYIICSIIGYNTNMPYNEQNGIALLKLDQNLNLVELNRLKSINNVNPAIDQTASFDWIYENSKIFIPYLIGTSNNPFNEGFGLVGLNNDLSIIFNKEFIGQINGTELKPIQSLKYDSNDNLIISFGYAKYVTSSYIQPNPYFPIATLSVQGTIQNLHTYGSPFSAAQNLELTLDNGILLMGQTNDYDVSSPAMTIMRIDSTDSVGECPVTDFDLTVTDVPLMIDSIDLITDTFPYPLVGFFLPVKNIYPIAREVCCDALPDATVQWLLPAYACGDSIGLDISICNTGPVNLPSTYPITIYGSDPQLGTAPVISTFSIDYTILADSCYQFTHQISNDNLSNIFMVIGDQGDVSPLEVPCDFPLDGITEECDYYNNVKSATIPDTIFTPLFQDDYFQNCNEDIILVAPYYVQNPVWNDTLTNDTIIARHGDWYYLRGTTPCGSAFFDSVEVIAQHPHLTTVADTLCLGDTLFFSNLLFDEKIRLNLFDPQNSSTYIEISNGNSFNFIPQLSGDYLVRINVTINQVCSRNIEYYVHIRPAPLTTIDITFCAGPNLLQNQTFNLQNDTLLTFQYPFSQSCDSTIQYQVTTLDTSYQELILSTCAGDTLLFQNTPIAAGENQTFVNTNTNGCDSTLFVSVAILQPSPTTEIFLEFCTGDSILIFDDYQQTAGIYNSNFTNSAGCDSLVEITLTELPVFQTEDLISICSGQSTMINGQSESQAGFYEAIFIAQNGCDSFSFVELELYATAALDAEITPSCPNETSGEISLNITAGDGPFSFDWSDTNDADSIRQNLAPGDYTLTLTDTHGCTSIHGYNVPTLTGEDDCAPRWYAPNAFSPNDDGRNDRFTFYANARMEQIELLEIFDRRGSLVFRVENLLFNDESRGWDGYLKGRLMNPQVFVWRAVVVDQDGNRENASGDVTLMR